MIDGRAVWNAVSHISFDLMNMHSAKEVTGNSRTAKSRPSKTQIARSYPAPPGKAMIAKVLVVEDEGIIASDISNRLKKLGFQVTATVATAEEAIDKAAAVDLVLMDICLDGQTDGVEAARIIRDRHHKPVIFVTARSDRATLDRAKTAEPFGYIVKPVTSAALHASIETALYKHRADRQIVESEAWLRAVVGSLADAVVVVDTDGRIVMLNLAAEAITGWDQKQARGQPVSLLMEAVMAPIELAILRDSVISLDAHLKSPSKELTIEGTAAPIKIDDVPAGVVLSFRDVSARRWEERQLRQSQKLDAVARLAFGVSSDYLNVLEIVRNQADRLLRQLGDYSPARKAIDEIQQAVSAGEQISRRLAVFGTRQTSQPEVISVNGLLRRATKLIESLTGPAIEVSVRTDPNTHRVKADREQIEQAIVSMALHASATMPAGGRILIETRNAELVLHGRVHFYAMLGIIYAGEEPDLERIFEPFSTGGEGLALSVVYTLVTEHGGHVSAQRTDDGSCRIEMLLPAWDNHPLAPRTETSHAPTILLIDERDQVRGQLHNFFEAQGYNLLEAADSSEALAISEVHEDPLDVLIADEAQAESIAAGIHRAHPHAELLRIVDHEEMSPREIRRPFTQQALLDRVQRLFEARSANNTAAG